MVYSRLLLKNGNCRQAVEYCVPADENDRACLSHACVAISPHCLRTVTSPHKSNQVFVALALRRVRSGAAERHLSLLINGNLHYSTSVFSFMALPSPFPDCGYDLL